LQGRFASRLFFLAWFCRHVLSVYCVIRLSIHFPCTVCHDVVDTYA
jgi:hypothetical protein